MSIKTFKTIDEQIELLKKRGLNSFSYNNDFKKLKWYLSKYNYQNLINGYNDFLMINNDRKTNTYLEYSTPQDFITLFNFDRGLSSLFIGDILNIERTFASNICYSILDVNSKKIKKLLYGEILSLSKNEIIEIFPKLQNEKLYKQIDDKKEVNIEKNIEEFKKIIFGHCKKDILKKYKNEKEKIPLWILSINWTFGHLNKIFNLLNLETQKDIFFKTINHKDNYTIDDKNIELMIKKFEKVMLLINDFRNTVCHGNVIYKFDYQKSMEYINEFIEVFLNKKVGKKIRLIKVLELIIFLDPHKSTSKTYNLFYEKLKKLNCECENQECIQRIHINNIDKRIYKEIYEWMREGSYKKD